MNAKLKKPLSWASVRAFTLLELMIVVALMAIVLAMSYPAIRGAIHHAPLSQAVMDVMEGCQKARELAIMKGQPAELRFYQDGHIEVAQSPADQDPNTAPTEASAQPQIVDPQTPPKPAEGFTAQLSDSVAIELFEINFTDFMNSEAARVRFYPNGTSDELTLVLLCEGERRKISLEVVTGLPGVETL